MSEKDGDGTRAMASADAVLAFWFGPEADDAALARRQADLWWGKNERTDCGIAARFGETLEVVAAGEELGAPGDPSACLATIILLDQFSRNIYRGTRRAFAQDAQALALCRRGLAAGLDRTLPPIRRVFFYMPLQHAEVLEAQDEAVTRYAALVDAATAGAKGVYEDYLRFAQKHREIIARFGRFPHRNAILGRASTPEEVEFLAQPGSAF